MLLLLNMNFLGCSCPNVNYNYDIYLFVDKGKLTPNIWNIWFVWPGISLLTDQSGDTGIQLWYQVMYKSMNVVCVPVLMMQRWL